ncbi:MAG: cellulase family glycosylhydrolase [Planctomycetota bacterium]
MRPTAAFALAFALAGAASGTEGLAILADGNGARVRIPGAPELLVRAVPDEDRPLGKPLPSPAAELSEPRSVLDWKAGGEDVRIVLQRAKTGVYLHASAVRPGARFRLEIGSEGTDAAPAFSRDDDPWIEAKTAESTSAFPASIRLRLRSGARSARVFLRSAAAGTLHQGGAGVPRTAVRIASGPGGISLFLSAKEAPAFPFLAACRALTERPTAYGVFEVESDVWAPSGPVAAVLSIVRTGAARREVAGFEDEGRLRFRASPMGTGRFSWSLRVSTLAGEIRTSPEEAEAVDAGEPGFVRAEGSRLVHSDGSPFVPLGANLGWVEGDRAGEGFERYFERMRAAGLTHARIWLCSWGIHLDGARPGEFLWDQERRLERVLAAARKSGITVTLVFENTSDFNGRRNGAFWEERGGPCKTPFDFFTKPEAWAIFESRIRRVLARFGADSTIAMFELWNEIDGTGASPSEAIPWVARAAASVKALDSAGRPVTVSLQGTGGWDGIWGLRSIDVVTIHEYVPAAAADRLADLATAPSRDLARLLRDRALSAAARGKPVLVSEFGANGEPGRIPVLARDLSGIHLREGLWGSALAGAAAPGWPWWWDSYIERNDLWKVFRPLADFLRGEEWAYFEPGRRWLKESGAKGAALLCGVRTDAKALLWIRSASGDWFSRVIEVRRPEGLEGQTVRLPGMRDGLYAVEWWDPALGRPFKVERIRTGGGAVLLAAPAGRFQAAAKVRWEGP